MTTYNFTTPEQPLSPMSQQLLLNVATATPRRNSGLMSETDLFWSSKITGGHI